MNYIVDPMSGISPLGCCNCIINKGDITYEDNSQPCNGYCNTFEICVTPTGPKMAPTGIKSKTQI